MTTTGDHRPSYTRRLRKAGLAGTFLFTVLAVVLWFGSDVVGTRECLQNGYGLGVAGGHIALTKEGSCEVVVPTTRGEVSGVVPTLSEPMASAALLAGLAGAVPPAVCLWLATRRPR